MGAVEKLLAEWHRETDREIPARQKIDMSAEERMALREKSGEVFQLKVEDLIALEMLRKVQILPFAFSGMAARFAPVRSGARIVCGLTGLWLILSGMKKIFF
ncbi:MAG: hypothetical protein R2941_04025 [Desulfobacterales bacterium]